MTAGSFASFFLANDREGQRDIVRMMVQRVTVARQVEKTQPPAERLTIEWKAA
jgi:hypothetical protein